jgi:hypothetical protein
MNGTYLRIEVHDPDARALPTLLATRLRRRSRAGHGLVDATADRWGVQLRADRKVTWCELATGLSSARGHWSSTHVTRAEAMLSEYGRGRAKFPQAAGSGVLSVAVSEEAVIDLIADLLHWLSAHGCDADEALDRAQTHFESEIAAFEDVLGGMPLGSSRSTD